MVSAFREARQGHSAGSHDMLLVGQDTDLHFSSPLVTRHLCQDTRVTRRKDRPDKVRDRGPRRGVLVQYVEEADGAQRSQDG